MWEIRKESEVRCVWWSDQAAGKCFERSRYIACSAGVFFERAICSRKRHVETSRREEEMGRVNTNTNKVSPTQNTPALQARYMAVWNLINFYDIRRTRVSLSRARSFLRPLLPQAFSRVLRFNSSRKKCFLRHLKRFQTLPWVWSRVNRRTWVYNEISMFLTLHRRDAQSELSKDIPKNYHRNLPGAFDVCSQC